MVGNPLYQKGPEKVTPSVCEDDNGESPTVTIQWEMVVPLVGGINTGSIIGVYENLHLQDTEHGVTGH